MTRVGRLLIFSTSSVATVKVWTGSAWTAKSLKVWNGTAWVGVAAIKTWTGSAWST